MANSKYSFARVLCTITLLFMGTIVFSESMILIGGNISLSTGETIPGFWRNGKWEKLSLVSEYKNGYVSCIESKNGKIISGGAIFNNRNDMKPAYWEYGKLVELTIASKGFESISGRIASMVIDNEDVYFGGSIDILVNGKRRSVAAIWKNEELCIIPNKPNEIWYTASVDCLQMRNKELVAAGIIQNQNGYKFPAIWTNDEWSFLDIPKDTSRILYETLCIINDNIIAVATYLDKTVEGVDPTWGIMNPVYWINGNQQKLPIPIENKRCWCRGVAYNNNDQYIAGSIELNQEEIMKGKTAINTPGYWKNSKWNMLPVLQKGKSAETTSILAINNSIVIGGWCVDADNNRKAVYWIDGELFILEVNNAGKKVIKSEVTCLSKI